MDLNRLFYCLIFLLHLNTSNAQKSLNSDSISTCKLVAVSSSLALALTGSYWYIENSWWSEDRGSFNFDQGKDLEYALNVDKAGHFFGGFYA